MNKKTTVDVNVPCDIATGKLTNTARQGKNPMMGLLAAQYRTLSADALTRWQIAHDTTFAVDCTRTRSASALACKHHGHPNTACPSC